MVLERAAALGPEPVAVRDALGRVLAEPMRQRRAGPRLRQLGDGRLRRAQRRPRGASAETPTPLAIVGESRAGHPRGRGGRAGGGDRDLDRGDGPGGSRRGRPRRGHRRRDGAESSRSRRGRGRATTSAAPARTRAREPRCSPPAPSSARPRSGCSPPSAGPGSPAGGGPRVAVLTTGDELQEPGEPLRPGAVRNSNVHSLAALVEAAGAELALAELVADTPEATSGGARARAQRAT